MRQRRWESRVSAIMTNEHEEKRRCLIDKLKSRISLLTANLNESIHQSPSIRKTIVRKLIRTEQKLERLEAEGDTI